MEGENWEEGGLTLMTQLDKLKELAMCRITESTQKDSFFRLHRMHRLQ